MTKTVMSAFANLNASAWSEAAKVRSAGSQSVKEQEQSLRRLALYWVSHRLISTTGWFWRQFIRSPLVVGRLIGAVQCLTSCSEWRRLPLSTLSFEKWRKLTFQSSLQGSCMCTCTCIPVDDSQSFISVTIEVRIAKFVAYSYTVQNRWVHIPCIQKFPSCWSCLPNEDDLFNPSFLRERKFINQSLALIGCHTGLDYLLPLRDSQPISSVLTDR